MPALPGGRHSCRAWRRGSHWSASEGEGRCPEPSEQTACRGSVGGGEPEPRFRTTRNHPRHDPRGRPRRQRPCHAPFAPPFGPVIRPVHSRPPAGSTESMSSHAGACECLVADFDLRVVVLRDECRSATLTAAGAGAAQRGEGGNRIRSILRMAIASAGWRFRVDADRCLPGVPAPPASGNSTIRRSRPGPGPGGIATRSA